MVNRKRKSFLGRVRGRETERERERERERENTLTQGELCHRNNILLDVKSTFFNILHNNAMFVSNNHTKPQHKILLLTNQSSRARFAHTCVEVDLYTII